jgi:hypothetical protein
MTARNQLIRTILMAVALLGVLVIAFSAWRFIDANNTLSRGERALSSLEGMDAEQQRAVMDALGPAYLIEQREASLTRNISLIMAGGGLVALGAAWLGYDLLNRRAKASN